MLIIDDDEVSREVLTLLAADAGYRVASVSSGDAGLCSLASAEIPVPEVILADMRMTGTTGYALAVRLRELCGLSARLIAMSSQEADIKGFDGFLRKPFTIRDLETILDSKAQAVSAPGSPASDEVPALDREVHEALRNAMSPSELQQLYAFCLDDSARRVGLMRRAYTEDEPQLWTDEAHAIRGSCGFVGALKLSGLAADMEATGMPHKDGLSTELDVLDIFLAASDDLRRMLHWHP